MFGVTPTLRLKIVVKYEDFITILLSQLWGKDERNRKCKQYVFDYIETIENIVKEGIEQKQIKEGNPKAIASEIYGLIASTLVYKQKQKEEINIVELYRGFDNTIINGLRVK